MTRHHPNDREGRMPLFIVLLMLLVPCAWAQDASKATAATATAATRPAWAADSGKDPSGQWADLVVNGTTQRLRWIAPGTFTMGSPTGEADREPDEAQHPVTLSHGYWLGDSEITRAFWQSVMGAPAAGAAATGAEGTLPVLVSWEDGHTFMARLNDLKPGLGADFPTEAQWEYACRAGTSGPTYAPLDAVAWYLITAVDAYGNTPLHAVKQKQANAWGLYDMLGNAWESTRDWHGEFPAGPATDPVGPATGVRHVVRGGSCRNAAGCCRAAWRWAEFPGAKGFGLRLVAKPTP